MNGKYLAQIHVNQKHLVNNFVIRKQTLPKKQFAEVIALPDDIISVTKTETINYTNGTDAQCKWCWCSPSTSNGHSTQQSIHCHKSSPVVSTQPKSSNIKGIKTKEISDNRNKETEECVHCFRETTTKSMVCLCLKPYTWCLSP